MIAQLELIALFMSACCIFLTGVARKLVAGL